jgi:hypothetical protein
MAMSSNGVCTEAMVLIDNYNRDIPNAIVEHTAVYYTDHLHLQVALPYAAML